MWTLAAEMNFSTAQNRTLVLKIEVTTLINNYKLVEGYISLDSNRRRS